MKFQNRIYTLFGPLVASLCAICWGCSEPQSLKINPEQAESVLPAQATRKAAMVLSHYLDLKDALVATESEAAQQASEAMRMSLVSFLQENNMASGNAQLQETVQNTADTLLIGLDSLIATHDASCEQQRIFFKPLSAALYRLLQAIDMHHITVYRQLCPMALNEQGAYWLSLSPDIENPYFGAKMLTCGELTDTIK
jgi:hypothetical protein